MPEQSPNVTRIDNANLAFFRDYAGRFASPKDIPLFVVLGGSPHRIRKITTCRMNNGALVLDAEEADDTMPVVVVLEV